MENQAQQEEENWDEEVKRAEALAEEGAESARAQKDAEDSEDARIAATSRATDALEDSSEQ